jgi:hypothetical protein
MLKKPWDFPKHEKVIKIKVIFGNILLIKTRLLQSHTLEIKPPNTKNQNLIHTKLDFNNI